MLGVTASRSTRRDRLAQRVGSATQDDVSLEHDRAVYEEFGELFADVVERVLLGLVERSLTERIGHLEHAEVTTALTNGAAQRALRLHAHGLPTRFEHARIFRNVVQGNR